MRISPYPPSFSRIAAKIIDPAMGASTWAFGSHKCVMKRGSLTRNAVFKIIHNQGVEEPLCVVKGAGDRQR